MWMVQTGHCTVSGTSNFGSFSALACTVTGSERKVSFNQQVSLLILCVIFHATKLKLSLKGVCGFPILFLGLFLKLLSEIQFVKITIHFICLSSSLNHKPLSHFSSDSPSEWILCILSCVKVKLICVPSDKKNDFNLPIGSIIKRDLTV